MEVLDAELEQKKNRFTVYPICSCLQRRSRECCRRQKQRPPPPASSSCSSSSCSSSFRRSSAAARPRARKTLHAESVGRVARDGPSPSLSPSPPILIDGEGMVGNVQGTLQEDRAFLCCSPPKCVATLTAERRHQRSRFQRQSVVVFGLQAVAAALDGFVLIASSNDGLTSTLRSNSCCFRQTISGDLLNGALDECGSTSMPDIVVIVAFVFVCGCVVCCRCLCLL
jgi:hypothetical protein